MLILLHGENQTASRKELSLYKEKFKDGEIIVLNGKNLEETELRVALETSSLFCQEKLIILENLFSQKIKTDFYKVFKENADKNIIFWENKEIGKLIINKLPKNLINKAYKYPVVIFKFLESLTPGNTKNSLYLLYECLKQEEIEMIFYMLVRQIRGLLIIKDMGNTAVSFSPWQKAKLTNQTRYFTIDKLQNMMQKLLQIDINIKTGASPYNLQKQVEQFIIAINDNFQIPKKEL